MKKDYTILVPSMLNGHFELIIAYMRTQGYTVELLTSQGSEIIDLGLRYVHNDTCYPALLVIGQFLHALRSGNYDPHKTALIYFQTGGGCRASNYISLLRKALIKADLDFVPVISLSLSDLEEHPGFSLNLRQYLGLFDAILYGDLLYDLVNQTKPYEVNPGDAVALQHSWIEDLGQALGSEGAIKMSRSRKKNYRRIVDDFAAIPKVKKDIVKVGIVGEIYVKFSPLGNNNLEQFLLDEGAEVVVPGLLDFFIYCIYNGVADYKLYGRGFVKGFLNKIAYRFLCNKKREIIAAIEEEGSFKPPAPFEHVVYLNDEYISFGVKMGEGWLLPAEMLELADSGVNNIVCVQPFGCLPNQIVGKGMMRPIKSRNPDINIVAIDYDPSATKVNQENRIKLMLATARDNLKASKASLAD
ncbi:MAG TPA: 2-hydroxyglutaryl-CoA dehydratase, partial [Clostridiaceae bacterium]|nr:2-hydroxyglutaryl-CoA dehydratase [Clostridiaceae bacterium]